MTREYKTHGFAMVGSVCLEETAIMHHTRDEVGVRNGRQVCPDADIGALERGPENMMNDDGDRLTAIWVGFVCGVVAGAALGVLIAPVRGRETREWIARHGRQAGRRAADLLDPTHASAVIRQHGIRGLLEMLRFRAPRPGGGPGTRR